MSFEPAPLSKTAKYKKITKPLLERKRRARINRCLDELKDLMVGALEIDDENLSKLEKADILELTVNHLMKLHSPKDPVVEAKKFQAGFGQCAAEACRFIMSVPDLDEHVSQSLVKHLSRLITAQPLSVQVPERPQYSPAHSPSSVSSDRNAYYSDQDRSSSDAEDSAYSGEGPARLAPRSFPSTPINGLLTTVDKLSPPSPEHGRQGYFNRVPLEAKDAILKKIRQHIMDKRGSEGLDPPASQERESTPEKCNEDDYKNDLIYPYSVLNIPAGDTLDLRKVRSPLKTPAPEARPAADLRRVERATEQCELPMDYNNLPPKKKRKLLEYQEYKKREETKRQFEAFCAAHSAAGSPDDADPKWRPW